MTDVDYARSVIKSSIARLDKVVIGLRHTNVDRDTIADYTEEIINMLESAYKALEEDEEEEKEDGWEV